MKTININNISVDFTSTVNDVIRYLHKRFGFKLWMVTCVEGNDWIVLYAENHGYKVAQGDVFRWADSFCSRMVKGLGPCVAPSSAAIAEYASAPIGQQLEIGAYIGMPLYRSDGELFGTLCAIDPNPQPKGIVDEEETIKMFARLLNSLLNKELSLLQEQRRAERAEFDSERDALTGLFNRRGWDKLLAVEESRCQRYGSSACVISIDLDDLKKTNDSLGHDAGDQLLIDAGKSLLESARPSDIVARIGGDEFLLLALECDVEGATKLVKRVVDNFQLKGIAASVGFELRRPDGDLYTARKESDRKMYEAKRNQKRSAANASGRSQLPERLILSYNRAGKAQ